MITAYFDDTGTHTNGKWGPSRVVAIAGIMGPEARLLGLEREWRKHLDNPLDGRKPPLREFHMYDCQNSIGEFTGWSRTETDYFCHQLGSVIVESGVEGYGIACSRNDWDELVTGDILAIMGDPVGLCIRNCFLKASEWAQNNTFDSQMTFVFDNFDDRPERQRDNRVVFDIFRRWVAPPPEIVRMAFLSSKRFLPLQAADYVAWEFYQHARDVLDAGLQAPKRECWNALGKEMRFQGQIARRAAIQQIVDHAKSHPKVDAMANHFRTFDPEASEGRSS